jgi:hypothetical protein
MAIDGTNLARSVTSLTWLRSRAAWPNALMAIGVSCRLVSRLVAVTVISSIRLLSAGAWGRLGLNGGRGDHGRHGRGTGQ